MGRTKLVAACIDKDNHRTEYQKLVNILVDDERTLDKVIDEHDDVVVQLAKLKEAYNNSADTLTTVILCLRKLLSLVKGVLSEDDYKELLKIITDSKQEEE